MHGEQPSWFQRFMLRFEATPRQIVEAELKQAQLAEIQEHTMAEYALLRMRVHQLTADYHAKRIERLTGYLAGDRTSQIDCTELPIPLGD